MRFPPVLLAVAGLVSALMVRAKEGREGIPACGFAGRSVTAAASGARPLQLLALQVDLLCHACW